MRDYFSNVLQLELASAEERCREEIAQDTNEAAVKGTLLSGARWLVREEILCRNLKVLGERVVSKLNELDPEHAPLQSSDFLAAKAAISDFRQRCEELHAEFRNKWNNSYPASRKPFDGGQLDNAEAYALNEIDGALAVFESKRSFWKWALGDLRRRVWSGALVLIGTAIGGLLIPAIKSHFGL